MRFEIYQGADGEWRWRIRAANSRLVATSGESFHDHFNAERAVKQFKRNFLALRLAGVETVPE